jgi:hypothetical protein
MEDINQISSLVEPGGNVQVVAKEFGAKFKSKRECYHFLSHECALYLSSYDTMTIYHLRDIGAGLRTKIKGKDVVHLSVPYYEHLTIKEFIDYADEHPAAAKALPMVRKETLKLPR